jgi:hypothetical protein
MAFKMMDPVLTGRLDADDASFRIPCGAEKDAEVAVRTLVAWAGDRRGHWAVIPPGRRSSYDPLGQVGHVAFVCGKGEELAKVGAEKAMEWYGGQA